MMRVLAVLSVGLSLVASGLSSDMKIKVGNEVVSFDTAPRKVNGVTMVPLRSMIDAMQGSMRWDAEKGTISAWKNSRRFDFVVNSRQAMVNDKPMSMDEAPMMFKNRIYVPLKFVADASGYMISKENGWLVLRLAK